MKDVEDTGTVNATICPVGPATADKEGDPESSVPPPNQESPAVATAGSTKLEDDDDDKYEEGVPKSGDNGGAPTGTNTPAEEDNGSFCSEDSSTCSDDDNDDDDTDSDVEAAAAAAATTTTGGGLYLSLTERRALNVQRNDNEMIRLGVAHGIRRRPSATERGGGAGDGDPSTPQRQRKSRKNRANPSIASPRGMLLFHQNKATAALNNDHAKNWNEIYPHRESLIRKLRAWVSVPIAMATTTPTTTNSGASSSNEKLLPFVPPPIFVSGPCGCGKTAIVRDVVQCATALANNTSNNDHRADASQSNNPTSPWGGSGSSSTMAGEVVAAHAYIDCVALDVRSVEEFVNDVHGQFARQIIRRRRTSNDNNSSSKRGGGVGGVSNARSPHQPSPPTTMRKRKSLSHRCDDPSDYGLQQQDQDRDIPNGGNDSISSAKRGPVSTVDHAAVPVTRRRASERNRHASSSNRSAILPPHAARVSRTNRGTASKGGPATPNPAGSTNNTAADASNSNSSALSTTPLIAAWNLGKLLQRLVAPPSRGSASGPHTSTTTVALFLVVDQADRLFSLGSSSSMYKSAADRINFLAQLLLLPRTLGLNLTIICISNSILLEHTGEYSFVVVNQFVAGRHDRTTNEGIDSRMSQLLTMSPHWERLRIISIHSAFIFQLTDQSWQYIRYDPS